MTVLSGLWWTVFALFVLVAVVSGTEGAGHRGRGISGGPSGRVLGFLCGLAVRT